MELRVMALQGMTGHQAGRQLLETMYWEKTGQPMPEICIAPGGKPYFADGSLYFSVSHTKRRVFCALSEYPIGIDAEELDRQIDLRLADKILSAKERVLYNVQEDKRLTLLRFWVLKEAAAKCSGKGLCGYPNHTNFSPEDERISVIEHCLVAVIEQKERNHAV